MGDGDNECLLPTRRWDFKFDNELNLETCFSSSAW